MGKPGPWGPGWLAGGWGTARGYLQEKGRRNQMRDIFHSKGKANVNADDNSIPSPPSPPSLLKMLSQPHRYNCLSCSMSWIQSLLETVVSMGFISSVGSRMWSPCFVGKYFLISWAIRKKKERNQRAHHCLSSCYVTEQANTVSFSPDWTDQDLRRSMEILRRSMEVSGNSYYGYSGDPVN